MRTWKGGGLARILFGFAKVYFEKTFLKESTVERGVCRFKMVRNCEWNSFSKAYFSFYRKHYYIFGALKHAAACELVKTKKLPPSTKDCSIMNHFIQIHILFGQCSIQAGMWRVKKLDYRSPSNLKTHKTLSRTTGHLEDISGTARQEGVFSEAVNSEMEHQSVP